MHLKTILNRLERQPGFVYGRISWLSRQKPSIQIGLRARSNSKPRCGGCGRPASAYDRLQERLFEFVPLWQIPVFFAYARRRVDCQRCGVTVELLPWAEGKHTLTTTYRWFLAAWAKRLSWSQTARIFGTTWQHVC